MKYQKMKIKLPCGVHRRMEELEATFKEKLREILPELSEYLQSLRS